MQGLPRCRLPPWYEYSEVLAYHVLHQCQAQPQALHVLNTPRVAAHKPRCLGDIEGA